MMLRGGFATYGKLPSSLLTLSLLLLCVHMVCVWAGVRANLQCMHTFQTDHMFICVKLKEQCVPVAYL